VVVNSGGLVEGVSEKAKNDGDVLAVMLFGSYVRSEEFSDVDVCAALKLGKFIPCFCRRRGLSIWLPSQTWTYKYFNSFPCT